MTGRWLKLALGLVAVASGPFALIAWNDGMGRGGFATPVGGDRWFSTRPGFFDAVGVQDPEMSRNGNVFNWTQDEATFRFPRLERSKPARVTMRIQGSGAQSTTAEVLFSVDGAEALRTPVPSVPKRISVDLPQRAGRGALVSLKIEGADGVMLENVRLGAVQGSLPVPGEALAALGLAGLVVYAALLFARVSPGLALFAALLQTTALGWVSVLGGAFLGRYSERLAWLSVISLLLAAAGLRVRDLLWRRAWIAVVLLTTLKFAILIHPQIIDADASFHADNLRRVRAGDWFFTSATPPPAISFPYPQGLSLAALPFSRLPQGDWVTLLRAIVLVAEILASLAFALAVATFSTQEVGALTFVLLALSPEAVTLLFVGNLANLFSDALMIAGCAFLIRGRMGLASLALLGGFLSHLGTLMLGAPLAFALALFGTDPRPRPLRRAAPVIAALVASFLLYYRHFLGIVALAWDRITHLKGQSAAGPMTAPVAEKLIKIVGGEGWWLNAVLLLLVIIGIATWPREWRPLARVLLIWALAILSFGLLGLITPVQVRSALAARPLVAALCAAGFVALWSRGRGARVLACALVLLIAVGCWTIALGFFPLRPA